ncbi:MAG: flap endonuclease [Dehalococcoidia bacterium]|nr:flap endonuclease [Dehalococcoidia bacterium]
MASLYLVDGTYELFRAHFGAPPRTSPDGTSIGAVTGLLQTLLLLLREQQPEYIACAFDHVVESFRNDLFEGYKTGEGTPEDLAAQFELAETISRSLGIVTWPMVEFEADDAIATATTRWKHEPEIDKVVICSVDKDLMNLVEGDRVVVWDRRRDITYTEADVIERFGVPPASIPDYLALVGDSADGIPGVPRWGAKGTATVLAEFGHIDSIPESHEDWAVAVRGARSLATNLAECRNEAELYRTLATLRTDVPLTHELEDLRWHGVPQDEYLALCVSLGLERLRDTPERWQQE